MIDAGLPLVQALDVLSTQVENKAFGRTLQQVKVDVESGSTYADALRKHPKTFNELKQVKVNNDYLDTEYRVSTRHRYIPTAWDDITASSIYQNDHHP